LALSDALVGDSRGSFPGMVEILRSIDADEDDLSTPLHRDLGVGR
jgi:hypothetical protein